MKDNFERVAAVIGIAILTAFLLGLGETIHETPFWIIVLSVIAMAWYGVYEECFKKKSR